MKEYTLLALDIGASSGRGIVGTCTEDGRMLSMQEVHRFENGYVRMNGGLYWDYLRIYRGVLDCLKACRRLGLRIDCIGVDTWAQDYAYIGAQGEVLGLPRCYHDPVNEAHAHDMERELSIDARSLEIKSGASFCAIATQRQLWYDRKHRSEIFNAAKYYLYIPYLLIYLLSGVAAYDDSLPAIGRLCDADTLRFSSEIAEMLGIGEKTPPRMARGAIIGYTGAAVLAETGYDAIPIACTDAHDTSSAVSAIPDSGSFLWVSSGSYNMFGMVCEKPALQPELLEQGFANTRLGDGRVCLMSGGIGMFFINQCVRRWKEEGMDISFPRLTEYALTHRTNRCFDFNDVAGDAADMPAELNAALARAGHSPAEDPYELYEAFCNSLARFTAASLQKLEDVVGAQFDKLYVVSGGAQADGVNQRLAELMYKPVYAGLVEAAALGNMRAQLVALGIDASRWQAEMREF